MTKIVTKEDIKSLYMPPVRSHKGQNGRLLVIGGSHLVHAASLWALQVASRIVDLVHYSSVEENNEIVQKLKKEFRNGIVISRQNIEEYTEEDDCNLIGPGMTRDRETEELTHNLLTKFPKKQWVIDAGALQMIRLEDIPVGAILTPHQGEWEELWKKCQMINAKCQIENINLEEQVSLFVHIYHCIVLVKGERDIVCDGSDAAVGVQCRSIAGGNAGMTKGGTGDVLAGLIAALATKNDPMLATIAGSLINKQAGDALYKKVGPYFNATDLATQIPETMKKLLSHN